MAARTRQCGYGEVSPADVERLPQSYDEQPAADRAWSELITALVLRRRRHDVEIADAAPVIQAREWDIELAG